LFDAGGFGMFSQEVRNALGIADESGALQHERRREENALGVARLQPVLNVIAVVAVELTVTQVPFVTLVTTRPHADVRLDRAGDDGGAEEGFLAAGALHTLDRRTRLLVIGDGDGFERDAAKS
jgi:hypothetical protein